MANYQELNAELEKIVQELQRDDLDIDKALEHYERGTKIVKELEKYLATAENKIQEIKTKFKTQK
jgi:exodeoxyribonuclease VII small subunit